MNFANISSMKLLLCIGLRCFGFSALICGVPKHGARKAHSKPIGSRCSNANIGALVIRTGFGAYYTIIIIRNPQNPILIIKAPTLRQAAGQKPAPVLQANMPLSLAAGHEAGLCMGGCMGLGFRV